MKKTNASYVKAHDEKQRAMGRKGRKVWATPEEHEKIRDYLKSLRAVAFQNLAEC